VFREIIALYEYYKNRMKPVNMFSEQNADIFNVKGDSKIKGKVVHT
jgi:hypothetical protein